MPKVFIIILNFNGWPDTRNCLKSLNAVDYDNFEVILIDNGSAPDEPLSSDGYRFKIRAVFNKQNIGYAAGNNQGIKMALEAPDGGADYILLLNNDTAVESDFLQKMVEQGEENKKIGILGPIIYEYSNSDKIQFAGGKINWSKTKGEHIVNTLSLRSASRRRSNPVDGGNNSGSPRACGTRDDIIQTDYVTGCCLLIKREVIEKIGPLKEDYFLYYEDTDWNIRSRRAGYLSVIAPAAKIYHKKSASSAEFSYPYVYYHTRNGLIFSARFGFLPLTYLISGWIFLKQLIKLAIGYRRDWARPVMRGIIDFWRGKRGKLQGYY